MFLPLPHEYFYYNITVALQDALLTFSWIFVKVGGGNLKKEELSGKDSSRMDSSNSGNDVQVCRGRLRGCFTPPL